MGAHAFGSDFARPPQRRLAGRPEVGRGGVQAAGGSGRRRGRRGGRGGRAPASLAQPRRAEPRRHEPASPAHASEAHTAPHDELVWVVGELAQQSPNGAVLLDTLARKLKAPGFSRPPRSPPLVTPPPP